MKTSHRIASHSLYLVVALVLALSAVLPNAHPAFARTSTLIASQDAYVDTNASTMPHNGTGLLLTYNTLFNPGPGAQTLLQFDLSGVSDHLTNGQLVLQMLINLTEPGNSNSVGLYAINDNWDEGTVTASVAPSAGSLLQTVTIVDPAGQVRFDAAAVGNYLEAERTGDGIASFLLRIDYSNVSLGGFIHFEDSEKFLTGTSGLEPFIEWTPWNGPGHFVEQSIGYTPSGYNTSPNFRQASTFTDAANSTISSKDTTNLFVSFDYDTTGKTVYLVYTTDGTAPTKSNGSVVNASFSNYADPDRIWRASIPPQPADTVVNYVFYASDNTLVNGWGRISGSSSARSTSQYQTSWSETDNAYFSFQVNGTADTTSQIGKTRTSVVWDATPNPTYGTVGTYTLTFNFVNNSGKTLRNVSYQVTAATKAFLMNPSDGIPGGVGKEINVANNTLPSGDSLYQSGETMMGQQYQIGVTGSGWKLTLAIYAVDNAARNGVQLIDTLEITEESVSTLRQTIFLPVVQR